MWCINANNWRVGTIAKAYDDIHSLEREPLKMLLVNNTYYVRLENVQ